MVLCALVCRVILGLIFTFLIVSLHAFLVCVNLFVLYGTPAMLGVPFI